MKEPDWTNAADKMLKTMGLDKAEEADIKYRYDRELPYKVELEDVLTEALEYFEDRSDADHNGDNFVPNKETTLAMNIRQLLYQIERKV